MEYATITRTATRNVVRRMQALETATRCARCRTPRTTAQRFVLVGDEAVCPGCNEIDDMRRRVTRRAVPSKHQDRHARLREAEAWLRPRVR